jgi:agmatinase
MSIEEQIDGFDVNGPGNPDSLFGLPFTPETARLVVIPVPWEATVSYRTGTARGPEAILKASRQIDFFCREIPDAWKLGIAMLPVPAKIKEESDRLRTLVEFHHAVPHPGVEQAVVVTDKINEASESLNIYVKNITEKYLSEGKMVGLLGGDHSSPLGFLRALKEKHSSFGILQIDAHADLRKAFEGFTCSHGSVMYNALKIPAISRLVQVGVRDFCEEESRQMDRGAGRVKTFFDEDLKAGLSSGKKTWDALCKEIVRNLPEKVFISFDIDGLDPKLCPHTGTPVPGGLEFHQATALIKSVATSGRTIIGFDLNEVAPGKDDEWDANVGARILWHLCHWTGVSNNYLTHIPVTSVEAKKG